ncbi:hypothetical protein DL771_008202 [Monosporascus sp. 5C6A]|nr:hypothetical protein DL771_008202 [Monosporascus sp. 5C6A]
MRAIPDFEFAARNDLDDQGYSYYRAAAAGEWTVRAGYSRERGGLNFAEATGEEDIRNALTSALTWDIHGQMKNHTLAAHHPQGHRDGRGRAGGGGVGRAGDLPQQPRGVAAGPPAVPPRDRVRDPAQRARGLSRRSRRSTGGGVRYGSDAIKLLALGIRAVGLGRPFVFASTYGVRKAIRILKAEIAADAAQLGIHDVQNNPVSSPNTRALGGTVSLMYR